MNNNTNLNLNITSYFLNTVASPDLPTWFTTGGPITKKNTTSWINVKQTPPNVQGKADIGCQL